MSWRPFGQGDPVLGSSNPAAQLWAACWRFAKLYQKQIAASMSENQDFLPGCTSTRPVAVMPTPIEALAAASMPGQQQTLQSSLSSPANLRSASTPMMSQQTSAIYNDMALFSQSNQLFPGAAEMAQQQQMLRNAETENRGGGCKSGDIWSSSVYAFRHQNRTNNSADEKPMTAVPAPRPSQLGGDPDAPQGCINPRAPQGWHQMPVPAQKNESNPIPLFRRRDASLAEREARILRDSQTPSMRRASERQKSWIASLSRGQTEEGTPGYEVGSAEASIPAGTSPHSAKTGIGLGAKDHAGQKPAASGLLSAPAITPQYLDTKFNMVISSLEGLTDVLRKGFADVAVVKDLMEQIPPKLTDQAAGMEPISSKALPDVWPAQSPNKPERELKEETCAMKPFQGELQQRTHPSGHDTKGTTTAQGKAGFGPEVHNKQPNVYHNVLRAAAKQGSAPTQVKAQVRPGVRISKPTVHCNVFSGKAVAEQGIAPTQVARTIASPFTEPSSDIPVNRSQEAFDPLCPSQSLKGESRSALLPEATLMDYLEECPSNPMTAGGTGKGHAPSPGKTQDQVSFASEDKSSEGSTDSWIDLLQMIKGSDDGTAATEEPTQAPTCAKPACTGGAVKLALPEKVLQEVWSLRAAGEHNTAIADLLEEAGCRDEIKMLQEISSKAMAKVQDKNCAKQSLLEAIAAVYRAVQCALSMGAQSADKDAGKKCALLLRTVSEWRPESGELMAALYEYQRPAFIKVIADSMEAICRAATAALKPVLSEKFMREAYNLTAYYTGSKVLQDSLEKVGSNAVLWGLQEVSSKGAATLRGTWAEQALEREVASVYKALEEALRLADANGNDLKLLQRYCGEGEEFIKDLYANNREYLIEILTCSMHIISEAAAEAMLD